MNKISIVGQIAEIDREIAMREKVYPREVQAGRMKKEIAEMAMARIFAARETLVFCQKHRAGFVEYMAAKKAGSA